MRTINDMNMQSMYSKKQMSVLETKEFITVEANATTTIKYELLLGGSKKFGVSCAVAKHYFKHTTNSEDTEYIYTEIKFKSLSEAKDYFINIKG